MENKKVQVLRWKCCDEIYAMCIEPHCYTSKDWQKDLKLAVKDGDRIEMVDLKDAKLGNCRGNCKSEPKLDL